eukprot:TRINITY_DN1829_c0_g1_i4.p1 TRINITY_DN1829_c0_g1~~TRINITY_DN1829_c0_g1_i4.p1  ORF type:complete len:372 (+),score=66.87 TRINITY_DN1829_c0_g1_i4:1-1116(+)
MLEILKKKVNVLLSKPPVVWIHQFHEQKRLSLISWTPDYLWKQWYQRRVRERMSVSLVGSRGSRELALDALHRGISSVQPKNLLERVVERKDSLLRISSNSERHEFSLVDVDQILIVGGGKAGGEMTQALVELIGDDVNIKGEINVCKGQVLPDRIQKGKVNVKFNFAGHPVPDLDGVRGSENMFKLLQTATQKSLILGVISGGSSALMCYPADGLSLTDLREFTKIFLSHGVPIQEFNSVRKHLSNVAGGRLVLPFVERGIPCFSFILSDVVGDDLSVIGSGPTVPDPTTAYQVLEICEKYSLFSLLSPSIQNHLNRKSEEEKLNPALKTNEMNTLSKVHNYLIGSASTSALAVANFLKSQNFFYYNLVQ